MSMNLFAQIRKVDAENRLVFGRAAQEVVDKSGEVMDYESSKPYFVKWMDEVQRDSNGQSLGNVRAMHGKVAAGKVVKVDFNDEDKAVDVCAKVVDDNEWKKVLEGVYTGFSIGGSYAGRKVEKVEGRDITRYTAAPNEVSLVDRPCIPTARFFEVQKADGVLEKVEFQHQPVEEHDDVAVTGSAEDVERLGKLMNDKSLSVADVIGIIEKGEFPPKKKPEGDADGDEGGNAVSDDDGDEDKTADECAEKIERVATVMLAKLDGGSPVQPERVRKLADMITELGKKAGIEVLQKAEGGDLNKADSATLEKLLAERLDPLTKQLAEQADTIKRLESQPAAPTVRLRAVAKSDDLGTGGEGLKKSAPAPIVDALGDQHEAAGLIKHLHQTGGAPLLKK